MPPSLMDVFFPDILRCCVTRKSTMDASDPESSKQIVSIAFDLFESLIKTLTKLRKGYFGRLNTMGLEVEIGKGGTVDNLAVLQKIWFECICDTFLVGNRVKYFSLKLTTSCTWNDSL